MPRTISGLGAREASFLAALSARDMQIFTAAEAQEFWGGRQATNQALYRLQRRGWLYRLEAGTYLIIPLEAGTERRWSASALVIAPYLVKPAAVAYWSALHYWQLTEQLPSTTFVQSTTRKRPNKKQILGMRFRFVTVGEPKFFGIVRRSLNGRPFSVTNREKSLVDAADRPELSGGIYQLAQSLQMTRDIDWPRLTEYLLRWPTSSPTKRIGYLIEALDLPVPDRDKTLTTWNTAIAPGAVLLEPGRKNDIGRTATRWQIRVNVTGPWSS